MVQVSLPLLLWKAEAETPFVAVGRAGKWVRGAAPGLECYTSYFWQLCPGEIKNAMTLSCKTQ